MLYAILAYHDETHVQSWTAPEDAAVMTGLNAVRERWKDKLGPAARLGPTAKARTVRGPGKGMVMDGPFAETKEQLLGFYVIEAESEDEAIAAAHDLRSANPSAVYEIRPIRLYRPGTAIPLTEA